MTFERCFMNWDEGFGTCLWQAGSKEELEALFQRADCPFLTITAVEEILADSLAG